MDWLPDLVLEAEGLGGDLGGDGVVEMEAGGDVVAEELAESGLRGRGEVGRDGGRRCRCR